MIVLPIASFNRYDKCSTGHDITVENFQPQQKVRRRNLIREMPKTLEDVADLGTYICALDKG
jgi:hypothetical protein